MTCQDCGSKMTIEKTAHFSKATMRVEQCACGSRFETEEKVIRRLPATASRKRATTGENQATAETNPATGRSDPGSDLRSVPISSPSSLLPGSDLPKQPDQLADPARWTPGDWKNRFGLAWANALHRGARHYGERGDGKACGDLGDLLDSLPEADVFEAQVRSSEMFAEYLAGRAPAVVQAGHCFAFFVTRWGALRIPPADRPQVNARAAGHSPVSADKDYAAGMDLFKKKAAP